ncbi:Glutathione S-transferase family protein [Hyphomicrobium sulfonivorans]|uniref:Glutathione S-transferase family protein n=1 Tax=Hyphomicrobium sulfonivorans TaxID=121290 RepID=A0A109BKT9_HYPSL|nr:glutathione S-transferase family protein [Hyphomicrobium sulfonivorans]KWT70584.1 Glutathione S-transferase family protein [Hyphomicrobium sulfonivorans]
MHTLTHFRLCPFSRAARLALAEFAIEPTLVEERTWEWRPEFLALNPAGELPVLQIDDAAPICGIYAIAEYLGDTPLLDDADSDASIDPEDAGADHDPDDTTPINCKLFPGTPAERAEIRRLVDWFNGKFNREITQELLYERVYARMQHDRTATPDVDVLRAIATNLRYHMSYINHLADQRRWLGGDELSFADLAAAAQLSVVDYLGEVPWENYPIAKIWYARLKSRRSFRGLLADRMPGTLPAAHYADLDF